MADICHSDASQKYRTHETDKYKFNNIIDNIRNPPNPISHYWLYQCDGSSKGQSKGNNRNNKQKNPKNIFK